MLKKFLSCGALFASALALGNALVPASAQADSMVWTMTSVYPGPVQFQLYSESRDNVWPDAWNGWDLNDFGPHSFAISCFTGEKICYGAWPKDGSPTRWGVGLNHSEFCTNCCNICGSSNPVYTMYP